jgi:isopenicillin-N epimerase
MGLARREFLVGSGLAVAGGGLLASCEWNGTTEDTASAERTETRRYGLALSSGDEWDAVREQFDLSPDFIHMSALLVASHPRPVREAIEEHRRGLDAEPVTYLEDNNARLRNAVRSAGGAYLGMDGSDIALTDSTTMGIGIVYNGLRLRPDEEILSTEDDYYVTDEAIRRAAQRTGATVRQTPLYDRIDTVSREEIVDRIAENITPATRVLAVTWVHSSTGLKLPLRMIADMLDEVNSARDEADQVLFCVDGVHGFGVEDGDFAELGCDFLMAGTHKWLFGPRGTGIVAGTQRGWRATIPTIPSFIDDDGWSAWLAGEELDRPTTADAMTPGGFKAFEHQWAMTQAFEFHQDIGKSRVAARTHELASQLKEGLAAMPHVTLRTPRSPDLSAGIVCFDLDGVSPGNAVRRLRRQGIIATATPYAVSHARLTPSIRNTPAEIEHALEAIRGVTS